MAFVTNYTKQKHLEILTTVSFSGDPCAMLPTDVGVCILALLLFLEVLLTNPRTQSRTNAAFVKLM